MTEEAFPDREALETLRNASAREIGRRWLAIVREQLDKVPTPDMRAAMEEGDGE